MVVNNVTVHISRKGRVSLEDDEVRGLGQPSRLS